MKEVKMSLNMKHLVKNPGEHVVGIGMMALTEMQSEGKCDCCARDLPAGTRVLGKSVNFEATFITTSRFSPTCMCCANLN